MENIKVLVSNEAESKEVQELFFALGYAWDSEFGVVVKNTEYPYLYAYSYGSICFGDFPENALGSSNHKQLTIPQLRDLVVLKRNSIDDATHIDDYNDKWFVNSLGSFNWCDANWMDKTIDVLGYKLKPIEKKEMKEFLVNHDNKWTLQLLDADTEENRYRVAVKFSWVNFAYKRKCNDELFFSEIELNVENLIFVWQRHTHPEELPFVDDEPKHGHYFKDVSDIDTMDVYEVLKRFEVTDPCLQHIVKKALCAGQRGHKDFKKDLQDILDTAVRAVDINK